MSYQIVSGEKGYDIRDNDGGVVIEMSASKKNANDICRKLNLGAGFAGSTPPFFAKKYGAT